MKQREIRTQWLATLAFALAFMGQSTALTLLFIYAIAVKKDEWLTEEVALATILNFLPSFVTKCIEALSALLLKLNTWSIYKFVTFLTGAVSIVKVVALVLIVLALIYAWQGKQLNIPFIDTIIDAIYDEPVKREKRAVKTAAEPVVTEIKEEKTADETVIAE